jgi:hypothetical protein
MPSQSTNTPNQPLPNMLPTRRPQSSMVHRFRGWRLTPHNSSPQRRSNASKTLLVPSYTIHKQLTQHFLLHSVPLQHAKAMAHGQWLMRVTNSSTMLHDMVLSVHTDLSYLSKPGSKSRAASHFYLSNCNDEDFNNGAILTLSTIIKHVMLSASEAELVALYYGCKLAASG